jgi:hypothetical protein
MQQDIFPMHLGHDGKYVGEMYGATSSPIISNDFQMRRDGPKVTKRSHDLIRTS